MLRRLLTSISLLLSAASLVAAAGSTYYVRVGGDDTHCTGLCSTPYDPEGDASDQCCAFATPRKAVLTAQCGDVVDIGEGWFGGRSVPKDHTACTSDQPLVIRGAGRDVSHWVVGIELTDCVHDATYTNTLVCTWPADALYNVKDDSDVFQVDVGQVEWGDENGCDGTIFGGLRLTHNTEGPASVNDKPGNWYYDEANGKVYLRPWSDKDDTLFFAPVGKSNGAGIWFGYSSYIELRDLSIHSTYGTAISTGSTIDNGSNHLTVENVLFEGGSVNFYYTDYQTITNIEIRNQQIRQDNTACTNCCVQYNEDGVCTAWAWDMNSQGMSIKGSRHVTMNDISIHNAREGFGISGRLPGERPCEDVTIDGVVVHSCWNHGIKIIDDAHNITIRNGLFYNNQEGAFTDCAYNLTFEHCFFADAFLIQGNPSNHCPDGQPRDIDIFNSVLRRVSFMNVWDHHKCANGEVDDDGLDDGECTDYLLVTRANGGYDLDGNVWVYENWADDNHHSDDVGAGSSAALIGMARMSENVNWFTLQDIQNGTDDYCADCDGSSCDPCTNDPHSTYTRNWEDVFVNYIHDDAIYRHHVDFHLVTNSAAYDAGLDAHRPATDLDGNPRDTRNDVGPYDRNSQINDDAPTARRVKGAHVTGVHVQ